MTNEQQIRNINKQLAVLKQTVKELTEQNKILQQRIDVLPEHKTDKEGI